MEQKPIKTYILSKPREIDGRLVDRIELWSDEDTKAWDKQLSYYKGKLVGETYAFRGEVSFEPLQAGDIVDRVDGSETGLVVSDYEDNACGEGCCQALYINGKYAGWPSEFTLNLKANGIEEV